MSVKRLLTIARNSCSPSCEIAAHHQRNAQAELAKRFVSLLSGSDITELDEWITQAANSELKSLANGIARDIDAVRAAITTSSTTSPVEGQISRIKAIKRQMYGRASYPLLRRRVLLAA